MSLRLTNKHINTLIKYKPDDMTTKDWLSEAIDKLQAIVKRREDLLNASYSLKQRWGEELDAIDKGFLELKEECPQWITTDYKGPFGGKYSYSHCEICGSDIS